ncbi:hypothetical protein FC07_GL001776 [Loigolactobacillus bifermentans DSM 20003]|uniref:Uncharacterized protein n=2 Tax=Loigolactobacillus bifermentans TaxID=1607 RepID=A0A0R1H016_9LACO|nr:hypothetical protein FC07_GL001776 [Loigolactobacillus bifermentans DSM 20003]
MILLFKQRNAWTFDRIAHKHTADVLPAIKHVDSELKRLRLLYGPPKKPLSAGTPSDQNKIIIHQYGTTGVRL